LYLSMINHHSLKHSHPFIFDSLRCYTGQQDIGFLHQGATFGPIGFGSQSF
jgi:hypothetical protein